MDTNEASKSNFNTVDIDSENEDVENAEIRKKEEKEKKKDVNDDPDLVYIEGGLDFEDNLNEKWKNLEYGTVLKR